MNKLTTERLEAIRQRAEKATEGPWFNTEYHVATKPNIRGGYPSDSASVCEINDGEYIENLNMADAEFIAHARQDIPDLLSEVERLKGLVAWYRHAAEKHARESEMLRICFRHTLVKYCGLKDEEELDEVISRVKAELDYERKAVKFDD